jgi:hypothetical protein
MCSKRTMDADGVCGKGAASFWKPVIVCCLLTYVSTVTGIGMCRWEWEPIECRGHPFGFDWKERRTEFSKLRNATDTEENDKLERPLLIKVSRA